MQTDGKNGFQLLQLGISGEIFQYIKSFLTNRTFQVRIGSSYSHVKNLENGLPQGSILSPILFSIMINDLPDVLTCPTALYADDCCFWQIGTDINEIHNEVQENLNRVSAWCNKWGFKLSSSKSAAVLFTRKHKVPNVCLKINGHILPVKNDFKYLGIIFQTNVTYNKHTKYVVDKCRKRINLLRTVKGTFWGAAKTPMLSLYRALVRSITDYGMEVYFTPTNVNKLEIEKIQNEALRLCTGALRSTPVCTLQHVCNEMPPHLRHVKLCLSYKAHLLTFAHHPAHSVITDSWYDCFPDSPNYRSFNLLTSNFFSGSFKIRKLYAPCNPLWRLPPCQIDLSLRNIVSSTNPQAANQLFLEHTSNNYNNYLLLYTDGSKTDLGTSSALFVHRHDVKRVTKINNNATVYTAELYAITTALIWISKTRYAKNLIISDSLSSNTAIHNHETNYRHPLMEKIKMSHYFFWTLSVSRLCIYR